MIVIKTIKKINIKIVSVNAVRAHISVGWNVYVTFPTLDSRAYNAKVVGSSPTGRID